MQLGWTNIGTEIHPAHLRSIPYNQRLTMETVKIRHDSHFLDGWLPAHPTHFHIGYTRTNNSHAVTVRAYARHNATTLFLPKVLASFLIPLSLCWFLLQSCLPRHHFMGLQQIELVYARFPVPQCLNQDSRVVLVQASELKPSTTILSIVHITKLDDTKVGAPLQNCAKLTAMSRQFAISVNPQFPFPPPPSRRYDRCRTNHKTRNDDDAANRNR